MNLQIFKFLIPVMILQSCNHSSQETKVDFLAANIDSSVSPAKDFYSYANGGWIKRTTIPPTESSWGLGDLVYEDLYNRLKKINEEAETQKAAEGTITQKIGDFWYSSMDTIDIEKRGISPISSELKEIESIKSKEDLVKEVAALNKIGIRVLFTKYVTQDSKNSDEMAFNLYQGGLGMPNRDYYFNTDGRTMGIRKAYLEYLFRTYRQLGSDSMTARQKSSAVFELESRMAKASRKRAELRDPYKNYNKRDFKGLEKLTPDFNWSLYIKEIGISKLDSVIIGQPEFFIALNSEINHTTLEIWKDYLRLHLMIGSAPFLDSHTYGNLFAYQKSFTGTTEPRVRWKRALDFEGDAMGEAVGQLFVKEYFNEKAKQRYSDLIEAIRGAFKERIEKLTWMNDSTKQKAFEKLAKITKKVGYPDKWKDFSSLTIDRGPLVLNMQRASLWWLNYEINKLGKPVDRTEWEMSPQTYNAYYNPSNNEIVMTAAGFTIPGMRDEDLDDAFVYGYAGANWIGHEMTHGFDDEGRRFDAKGNLKSWWQKDDSVQFVQRAQLIIRQFNEFNPVDTLHVNGEATQGENIADLGGLVIGLDAFRKTKTFKEGIKIGGFTPLQRFFLGYAYGWLSKERKEALARQVMTDPHSPSKERVNGPVVNMAEFYEAFGVKPGDMMYRPDSLRVNIW